MREICVKTARPYSVQIAPGLLSRLGELTARAVGAMRAAVISDDAVFPLYGPQAEAALSAAGIEPVRFVFPRGEAHKNLHTYAQILNFLCHSGFDRSDTVVALGGGVVGDLAGFAAATYQRGLSYVQVPTTLLSMADASVGGKTAVDLPGGKNQAGCFHQPALVVCDPRLLASLPPRQMRCGWAEVIKTAMLFDPALFEQLGAGPEHQALEDVIARCIEWKAGAVARDEFDRGSRALLNLGHTVGHAVEGCRDDTRTHGEAVAAGMAAVTRGAAARGICGAETLAALLSLLRAYGLPTQTDVPLADVIRSARADKKRTGGKTALIVPEAVGRCRLEVMTEAELTAFLRDGGLS